MEKMSLSLNGANNNSYRETVEESGIHRKPLAETETVTTCGIETTDDPGQVALEDFYNQLRTYKRKEAEAKTREYRDHFRKLFEDLKERFYREELTDEGTSEPLLSIHRRRYQQMSQALPG
jgi:hypothetical protein